MKYPRVARQYVTNRDAPRAAADGDETQSMPIGLVSNPKGVPFHCRDCQFYDDGKCWNKKKKLTGTHVEPEWCCNLFRHPGMKVIIR
jgi:hypothetical protein